MENGNYLETFLTQINQPNSKSIKSDLVQTDKHSIKILLQRKNLRFLSRTNHNTKPLGII
jgi:hypothetical protein